MTRLFIIGNGFDLAHKIKTSYEDFHQYLRKTYPDAKVDEYVQPESTTMPDGGESYDDDEVVGFLSTIITNAEPEGDNWSDLERSLGLFDLDEYFDGWIQDEDENPYHEVYRNQDLSAQLVGAVLQITNYFSDWIDTIEIQDVVPLRDFERLLDREEDLFLTFNYTRTLEDLYDAMNVCHIHGVQGSKLWFGHGNDTDYYEEHMSRYIGSEDSLQDMQHRLRKNTSEAMKVNRDFFNRLTESVDRIYSFGFSFSEVDLVYIEEVCRRLATANVTWYLNDYDDETSRQQFEQVIKSCGFKGQFDTYHIS